MALTKTSVAITEVTATGQSDIVALADSYRQSAYVRHTGNGTITAGAMIVVQVRPQGSSLWYEYTTIQSGTVNGAEETWVVGLPEDAGDVRFDYTSPVGASSQTLNAEIGKVTGIQGIIPHNPLEIGVLWVEYVQNPTGN